MPLKSDLANWSAALPETIRDLIDRVLKNGIDTQASVRIAAFEHAAQTTEAATLPGELRPWVTKVASHAYKTLDRDVDELKRAGYSDGAIFELTVATAVGAGAARYQRGLEALEEALR